MGVFDDAWRDSVRTKKTKNKIEEEIFDDDYLAEVSNTVRTSDGDFTTVGNKDLQDIRTILKHLINKLDKIAGMK
tara:strand:- start:924 stop:1148 length:225 start_codon:yes stop_codon:yes gene_type:complete